MHHQYLIPYLFYFQARSNKEAPKRLLKTPRQEGGKRGSPRATKTNKEPSKASLAFFVLTPHLPHPLLNFNKY